MTYSGIKKLGAGILIGAAIAGLPAEEHTLRAGLSVEGSLTAPDAVGFGRSFSLEYQFFTVMVNGIILTVSDDFMAKTIIEPELFARWYFLRFGALGNSLFIQGGIGVSVLVEPANSESRILAGITTGCRFFFQRRDYFIEPYLKAGYPFIVGLGFRAGVRL